jgi:hypothetical protein
LNNAVLVLSLLTGQDIIGHVEDQGSSFYVTKPAAINVQPRPDGSYALGLMPYPPLADIDNIKKNGVHINKSAVITAPYEPNESLREGYKKVTSALLLPAKPQLITG